MKTLRVAAFAAAIVVAASATAQAPAPAKAAAAKPARPAAAKSGSNDFRLVVEPRAMDILRAMSAKLAAARSMTFTATVGYEYPSKLGPPIVYTTRYDVVMQRPDKLRVVTPGDGPSSEFYFDGRTMTAYAPAENLAAIADAPSTMDAMLATAYRTAGIYYPFTDLLLPDPYAALADRVKLAFVIGPSSVDGAPTQMIGWANDDVFIQAWIGADDMLPRRLRAVFRADPLRMRHDLALSNWQLDPALGPDTFVQAKAPAAGRMAFAAPSPPPKGARPLSLDRAPSRKQ